MTITTRNYPVTVQEAVEWLYTNISLNDEILLSTIDEESLVDLHFSLGYKIRSEFGLWSGNGRLLESCRELSGNQNLHVDDASLFIIRMLWTRLREEDRLRIMTTNSVPLPTVLQEFVNSIQWIPGTTSPEWPYEYIVRDRVEENFFMLFVEHIRSQGYEAKFYEKVFTYYDHAGMVYWTMGEPLGETSAIYRCRKEDTYEFRRIKGTLPDAGVLVKQL